MTSVTVKAVQATFVNQASPTRNYSKNGTMALRETANSDCRILAKFTVPGPKGATFTDGKFRIYASKAIPSRTYRLRLLTKAYAHATVKWSGQPTNTSAGEVVVTAAVAAKGYLEFDVTALLNSISAGGVKWYGFLILMDTADATARYFYTAKGSTMYGPRLVADYSTAPRVPTGLNPSGGRAVSVTKPTVTAEFMDLAGSTRLNAVQVKIHNATFDPEVAVTDFDSGAVLSDAPQLDLATTSFTGISAGQTRYWSIRFQDGDDLWGPWAPIQSFTKVNKGVVAITNPGEPPNDFVEEATPPIIHTFTGGTQKSVQVLLWNDDKTEVLADTGKITTDDLGQSLPEARGLVDGVYYRTEVRVWDNVERASTPGDVPFASAERRFRYVLAADVTATANLKVTQIRKTPWARLEWTRTTMPDFFDIFRDGRLIASGLAPEDLLVSGTTYEWVDRLASPNTPHKWEVRARVNGRNSAGNSTVTTSIRPLTAFLSTLDGAVAIPLLNYSPGVALDDGSTVIGIANSDEPITIYQGLSGWKGNFEGILSRAAENAVGAVTARDHLNAFLALREESQQGRVCVLTWADQSIPCVLSKLNYTPTVYQEEIVYVASFYITEKKDVLQ